MMNKNVCKNGHLTYGEIDKCPVCGEPIIANTKNNGTFETAITGFITMKRKVEGEEPKAFEVLTVVPVYCEYENFEVTEDMIVRAVVPVFRLYGVMKPSRPDFFSDFELATAFFNYMRFDQDLRIEYGCAEFWRILFKIVTKLSEIFGEDKQLASEISIIKETTEIYKEIKGEKK